MKRVGALLGRVAAIAIIGLFAVSGMARIVSASLALPGETAEEAGPATASPPGLAAVEELELLLRDISRRDTELARREATQSLREQDMRVARDEIDRAILELEEAEAALEARMFASDTASEGDLTRLTAIYEGMKPKDAAALFGTMDPGFASGFLGRMSPEVAASVLSSMDPLQAYAISATIAGRNVDAATAQPGPINPSDGGSTQQ